MLEEAGLTSLLRTLLAPKEVPFWKKLLRWIYVAFGILGIACTLWLIYPWLSLEEGGMLDPSNPYSALWTLTNHGIPITNVEALCATAFTTVHGNVAENKFFTDVASYLGHEGTVTAPCFGATYIHPGAQKQPHAGLSMDDTVQNGSLTIVISYGTSGEKRWLRHQTFHYVSLTGADGTLHWRKLSP
jgi:hypothetical protein